MWNIPLCWLSINNIMIKYRHGPRPFVSLFLCCTVIGGVFDFVLFLITSPPEGVARYCFHTLCLSVCLCICICVCPANILVFYFSAIRRDIDLHRWKVKVTLTVHCLLKLQSYHKNWVIDKFQFFPYTPLRIYSMKQFKLERAEKWRHKNTSICNFKVYNSYTEFTISRKIVNKISKKYGSHTPPSYSCILSVCDA